MTTTTTTTTTSASAWARFIAAPIDPFVYGLVRVFFGIAGACKFLGLTSPLPRLVKGGFELGFPLHRYGPKNFAPGAVGSTWLEWLPVPSLSTYCAVESVALGLACAVIVGLAARLSTLLFGLCCLWLLLVDPAGFKHNLFANALFGILLALGPCGARCSVDALWRRHRRDDPGPTLVTPLPLRLLQVQVAVVYLFSTLTKLNDGWWTGHLLRSGSDVVVRRLARGGHDVLAAVAAADAPYVGAAWATLVVEAFLVVGLLVPRWRGAAWWLGVALHTAIDVTLDVGSYTLTMLAVYVAFVRPAGRESTLHTTAGHPLRRLVGALDWLARIRVAPEAPEGGADVALTLVDGRVLVGREAWAATLLRLPLTFLVVFPWAAWRRRRAPPAR